MRNTHKTIAESEATLNEIFEIADSAGKEVVTYISMGFGNPYGDPWDVDIVGQWTEKLAGMGARILSLSDTVGTSDPETIHYLFSHLIPKYPHIEFGAHLHTTPQKWHEKLSAAYHAGCTRFDGAVQGFGGCPMAKDELTGNMLQKKCYPFLPSKRRTVVSIGCRLKLPITRQANCSASIDDPYRASFPNAAFSRGRNFIPI